MIKDKNYKCEGLRVEWDGQKKSVAGAAEKHAELEAKGHPNAGQAQAKLDSERAKESAMREQFLRLEVEVRNEMFKSIE